VTKNGPKKSGKLKINRGGAAVMEQTCVNSMVDAVKELR
jgi:hypothetical protein